MRERVEALEAEKVELVVEKDEAVASTNKLLDAAIMARVENKELSDRVDSFKFTMEGTKAEMEIRVFRNDIKECRSLIETVASPEVLERIDCDMANNLLVLDMHMEIPNQEGHPKVYVNDKAGSNIFGSRMDNGPDPDFDYILSDGEKDLVLSEKEESESESDEDKIPLSKFAKSGLSSKGTDAGQGSGFVLVYVNTILFVNIKQSNFFILLLLFLF
ncbi:hypothetical protein ACOSQ4_032395 [Xanthoceras sorbifolium]